MLIDKTNWIKVKFGDVVFEKKITIDAENCGLNKYIAGEHMSTEDLHIRKWGVVGDGYLGPAFHRKFEIGDILYGSRRTYLKKVAVANFDGITANTTFVLTENKELVVPGFVPLLMLSDTFTEHSVKNSKGSVNPYINYKDIAKYEFLLPPKDQQARLTELLWAADKMVEKYHLLSNKIVDTYQYFIELQYSLPYSIEPLGKFCDLNKETLSTKTSPDYKFQYLDIASITSPKVIGNLKSMSFKDAPSRARRIVKNGNIVLSLVRPYFQSFVIIENAEDIIASTGTAVLSVNDNYDRYYIFHLLFSKRFLEFCEERMMGTNYPSITPNDIKEYKIPFIPFNKQKEIGIRLQELDNTDKEIKKLMVDAKRILNLLINKIFTVEY